MLTHFLAGASKPLIQGIVTQNDKYGKFLLNKTNSSSFPCAGVGMQSRRSSVTSDDF
jgi:hypothetical protein